MERELGSSAHYEDRLDERQTMARRIDVQNVRSYRGKFP